VSRRRRRGNKGQGNQQQNQNQGQNQGGGGGGGSSPQSGDAAFWAEPAEGPGELSLIRPTPQPDAVPRSLGDPPLTPDTAAQHHLAVVYEEAVRAATALAAANGLLADDES
jgi:hypothetical protein